MAHDPYTVVVPTYQRYPDCVRAVRSALAQTVPPQEVIVVDDASPDQRYQWLEEIIADDRLVYLRAARNSREVLGVDYAIGFVRNYALSRIFADESRRGWIAFLDDDDGWMPQKMERQLVAAQRWDYHRLIGTNAINRDEAGVPAGRHHDTVGRKIARGVFDVTEELRTRNVIINSTAMIGVDIARQVGFQRETGFMEDWDYWRRACRVTPALFLDEPLACYTVGNQKHYRY